MRARSAVAVLAVVALAGASTAFGCTAFDAASDDATPSSDAAAETATPPMDDGAVADGATTADGASTSCSKDCDTPCVDGVCPPHVLATRFVGVPVAIAVGDQGIYVADRVPGATTGGGIARCGPLPNKGATCSLVYVRSQSAVTAVFASRLDKRIFYSFDFPGGVAYVDETGDAGKVLPLTGAHPADVIGAGTTIITVADNSILRCVTTVTPNPCQQLEIGTAATSIDSRAGYYCFTAAPNTDSTTPFVGCGDLAGNPAQLLVTDPASNVLGRIAVSENRAYWSNGTDIHSLEMSGSDAGAGATIQAVSAAGGGPFDGDINKVYFARGAQLFYATRTAGSPKVLAAAPADITAVVLQGSYVYFAYGDGLTSGLARVPK